MEYVAKQVEQQLWITLRAPKADAKKNEAWKSFWKYGKILIVQDSKFTLRQLCFLVASNTWNLFAGWLWIHRVVVLVNHKKIKSEQIE